MMRLGNKILWEVVGYMRHEPSEAYPIGHTDGADRTNCPCVEENKGAGHVWRCERIAAGGSLIWQIESGDQRQRKGQSRLGQLSREGMTGVSG